jgi:cytochrome P450
MLRWESPADMAARIALEPWTIVDISVPAGETLYCMAGAANHDP